MLSLVTVLVICAFAIQDGIAADCTIVTNNQTERMEPLFLVKDLRKSIYKLFVPRNNDLKVKEHTDIYVACPSVNNHLVNTDSDIEKATCADGQFNITGEILPSTEKLQCVKPIRAIVRRVHNLQVGKNGYIYEIGFKFNQTSNPYSMKGFLTLIKICHDPIAVSTLYTEHTIHGHSIYSASKAKFRPSFAPDGLKTQVAPGYNQRFQRILLANILGSSVVDNYLNDKSFISRGHLAPDADFQFAPWQFATYFYLNTCPQWQAVNGGNWLRVESITRQFAGKLKEDLQIVTGTYEVLKLPDFYNVPRPVFLLPENKLPIPKFNWKVLYRPKQKSAIVFVIFNNPFATKFTEDDYLCEDVCNKYGWGHSSWRRFDKGAVYCCEYDAFANNVEYVPKLRVEEVLYGNLKN